MKKMQDFLIEAYDVEETSGIKVLVLVLEIGSKYNEVIAVTSNAFEKVQYIKNYYDNDLTLKSNANIKIISYLIV